ncbi:MAG: UPF0182 family membrane protein [Actinomycetota bacterium]
MFMRTSPTVPTGRRRGLFQVLLVLVGLYLLLSTLATVWTDYLWFSSLGFEGVWLTRAVVRIALTAGVMAMSFLFVFGNLALAERMSLRHLSAPGTEDDEVLMRLRDWAEPRLRTLRLVGSGVLAVLIGASAGGWSDRLFLFMNPQGFGLVDPLFGNDLGFYVFRLPLVRDLLLWGFNLVLVTTLVVGAAHYLNGALRLRRGSAFFSGGAKVQISLLVAGIALMRAALYRLDAYGLLLSGRSAGFFGAGYTDVNARLPALRLLLVVAIFTALCLIVNIWRTGWILPLVAGATWLLVSIGAGVVYPAIVEKFQVEPNPLSRQRQYIAHNISFTRAAYGLDDVKVAPLSLDGTIAAEELERERTVLDNIRLWDSYVLGNAYSPQEFREYYELSRVDSDRYVLNGEPTQVMLSVRELDPSPDFNWQLRRLSYTHGYGLVASYAARVGREGEPEYLISEMPPVSRDQSLEIDQPRIYYGEILGEPEAPVIVRNQVGEIDYPTGPDTFASSDYQGTGGVELSSIWHRLAFGLRYRDLNLVISGQIRADSRILMERDLSLMIERLVPFLGSDSDPYPVVVDGRVKWVVDLYSMTASYPYSTPITVDDRRRLPFRTHIPLGANYIRNSVKAVIDAYDGNVIFYAFDPSDPILAAWRRAFPGLVRDGGQMPEGLRSHVRYPMDLFTVQTEIYRQYHVTDPAPFFGQLDAWEIPGLGELDEGEVVRRNSSLMGDRRSQTTGEFIFLNEALPYYMLMRFDGDLSYVSVQPFAPRGRQNLAGYLLVDSSPDRYGEIIDYRMPTDATVAGIEQVALRIEADPDISSQFTLWRNRGSRVIQGDIMIIPVGNSQLYVQPVFLEAEGGGLPQFERVVVVHGEQIDWGASVDGVLASLFGEEAGTEPEQPPPSEADLAGLLEAADAAFTQADAALRSGDLARYQQLVEQARALLGQALELVAGGAEAGRLITLN